jgi:hypothetical protein
MSARPQVPRQPTRKRSRSAREPCAGTYEEFYSSEGVDRAWRELSSCCESADRVADNAASPLHLPPKLLAKKRHDLEWLDRLCARLSDPREAPAGLGGPHKKMRTLSVTYSQKRGVGRRFPEPSFYHGPAKRDWSSGRECATALSLQGCSRRLRPILVGGHAWDIDAVAAHPSILLGLARKHALPADCYKYISNYCKDRTAWFDALAQTHEYADTCSKEEQKELGKVLFTRLLYGGSYAAWLVEKLDKEPCYYKPRCPKYQHLSDEIVRLRNALFRTPAWAGFVERLRVRLVEEGEKSADEIKRSMLAAIANEEENRMLLTLEQSLRADGWTVMALMFDGLLVEQRADADLTAALRRAEVLIEAELGYKLHLIKKPLTPN